VEPEAADFWQEPGETFELRADGDPAAASFELVQTPDGLTVYLEGGTAPIFVFSDTRELACGHSDS
jgi:hypothetical protein